MSRWLAALLVGLGLWAAAAPVGAQGLTGRPAPEIQAGGWLNAPPLTLAALRGRIVVVEFWATWCPPCRTSIPHLIALSEKYKSRGVVFLGLTNEPKAKVEPFAAEMKMTYAVGMESPSGSAYGVRGIPRAFVVDTGGQVVWEGHPMAAEFEAAIQKQLQEKPPSLLSAEEKAAIEKALEKVDQAAAKGQHAAAAALLAKVKGAEGDPALAARVTALRDTLAKRAAERLAQAEKDVKAGKYYEASVALDGVAVLAPGSETASQAAKVTAGLEKDPKARSAIEKGRREKQAADVLAEVEKGLAKKPAATRLEAYDDVATRFPGTDAGKAAADKAAAMRADKTLMAGITDAAAEKDCRGWLSMARNFLKSGLPDKAKPYLDRVIEKYPDTDFAAQARKMLADLGK